MSKVRIDIPSEAEERNMPNEPESEGNQKSPNREAPEIQSFICPNCGGTMSFDINSQQFKCSSCGGEEKIANANREIKEYDFREYHQRESRSTSFEGSSSFTCQGCGGEVILDTYTTATVCPMCGSSQVVSSKQTAGIPPEGVIPFKIDQYDAQEKFRLWIKSRWFAPSSLKRSYQEGCLKGMYMPFWTYDAQATAYYWGRGGNNYTVEDSEGNTETKTKWYSVSGTVHNFFDDVTICASKQHEHNAHIRNILPFSTTNKTLPYDPSYLSGFSAEHYSIKADAGFEKAKEAMESNLKDMARQEILRTYDEAEINSMQTQYYDVMYKHLLLPIWKAVFMFNNKHYEYIINGETGVVSGDRPYSPWKIGAAILAAIAVIALLYYFNS